MKDAGASVRIMGSGSKKSCRGKTGSADVAADASADKVEASQFDAIIVPLAYAPDKMRLHQPTIDLVRKAHAEGKIIAAIYHGPQFLISTDIVRGRRLTSWPSVAIGLKNAGVISVDEPIVSDGNITTSRKPADVSKFSKAIIEALL